MSRSAGAKLRRAGMAGPTFAERRLQARMKSLDHFQNGLLGLQVEAPVTRQMTLPTSSATKSDPSGPSVTPTGRP